MSSNHHALVVQPHWKCEGQNIYRSASITTGRSIPFSHRTELMSVCDLLEFAEVSIVPTSLPFSSRWLVTRTEAKPEVMGANDFSSCRSELLLFMIDRKVHWIFVSRLVTKGSYPQMGRIFWAIWAMLQKTPKNSRNLGIKDSLANFMWFGSKFRYCFFDKPATRSWILVV